MSKSTFNASKRINEPTWLILKAQELLENSFKNKDASNLIYASLELRNALEVLEFDILLCATPIEDHESARNIGKVKNGISKLNKETKTLNNKRQKFIETVCKVYSREYTFFDYQLSKELKESLNNYIHTYTKKNHEFEFYDEFIIEGFNTCRKAITFISTSINNDTIPKVQSIVYKKLEDINKETLYKWLNNEITDVTELETEIIKMKNNQ